MFPKKRRAVAFLNPETKEFCMQVNITLAFCLNIPYHLFPLWLCTAFSNSQLPQPWNFLQDRYLGNPFQILFFFLSLSIQRSNLTFWLSNTLNSSCIINNFMLSDLLCAEFVLFNMILVLMYFGCVLWWFSLKWFIDIVSCHVLVAISASHFQK